MALDARAAEEERSAATETLAREKKAKDAALRRLRKAQLAAERAAEQLPELKDRREALELDARDLARERDTTAAAIAETRDEIHATTSEYLREESKGKERGVMFEHLHAEVMELEAEIVALKSEERARAHRGLKAGAARSGMARRRSKEQAAEVRQRDALAHDLKKRRRDITNNIKEFDKLYEMVKEQRNAFVTLITSSRRSVAELREKLKILANEIDVLRGESADKETTLFRTHQDHAKARSERDSARAEMNKARVVFRERREELDEQISIIDSLGDVVDAAEKEMLRMRRRYEDAVERRNQTGVALIDRNDELCILYEKANLQEEVSRRGEIELRRREDEIRALTIEVADAERSIEVARRTMTRVPGLDEQVASLQAQLLLEPAGGAAERRARATGNPDGENSGTGARRWRAAASSASGATRRQEEQLGKIGCWTRTRSRGVSERRRRRAARIPSNSRRASTTTAREFAPPRKVSWPPSPNSPCTRPARRRWRRSAISSWMIWRWRASARRRVRRRTRTPSGSGRDRFDQRRRLRRRRGIAKTRRRRARTGPRSAAPRRDRTRTFRRIRCPWACSSSTRRSNRRGGEHASLSRAEPGRSLSRERRDERREKVEQRGRF